MWYFFQLLYCVLTRTHRCLGLIASLREQQKSHYSGDIWFVDLQNHSAKLVVFTSIIDEIFETLLHKALYVESIWSSVSVSKAGQ